MLPPRVRSADRRRGVAAVEFLLVVPVLMIVVAGMVGIADLLVTEQLASEASGRAARVAAVGGSPDDIEKVIAVVLGPVRAGLVEKLYIGPPGGEHQGDDPHVPTVFSVEPNSPIEVRFELPARKATATGLVPVGADDRIIARSVMLRE